MINLMLSIKATSYRKGLLASKEIRRIENHNPSSFQVLKLNLNLKSIWYAGSLTATSSPSASKSSNFRFKFGRVCSNSDAGWL